MEGQLDISAEELLEELASLPTPGRQYITEKAEGEILVSEYAERKDVAKNTARRHLNQWVKEGKLTKRKITHYGVRCDAYQKVDKKGE